MERRADKYRSGIKRAFLYDIVVVCFLKKLGGTLKVQKKFAFEEHTADVVILAHGNSLEEAFANVGYALVEIMTNPDAIEPKKEVTVEVIGFDMENLLYRWVEEFLFLFDSQQFIPKEILVESILANQSGEYVLKAKLRGETYNPNKHESRTHIKAPTYSLIGIWKENDTYKVRITVDI